MEKKNIDKKPSSNNPESDRFLFLEKLKSFKTIR